jgi:hypothetical protein
LIVETKALLYDEFAKLREMFTESVGKVDEKSDLIQRMILDVKFWIDSYNESFNQAQLSF